MKPTLIFDWDGTLHETAALYGNAVRTAYDWLVEQGVAPSHFYSDEEISRFLGMSAPDMWASFMPELSYDLRDKAIRMVGEEMLTAITRGKAHLYPHTEEVLTQLKAEGHTLLFLSNCAHDYMEAHRAYFNLDRWFSDYYAAEDYDFKPKTEIFNDIRQKYDGPFMMIGDRASDMAVATHEKVSAIGCAYGYGKPDELAGANYIIQSISELPSVLKK